jgi:bifunctional DNase/RNase
MIDSVRAADVAASIVVERRDALPLPIWIGLPRRRASSSPGVEAQRPTHDLLKAANTNLSAEVER